MSIFLGSFGMNRSTGQTNRANHEAEFTGDLFVMGADSFPMNSKEKH